MSEFSVSVGDEMITIRSSLASSATVVNILKMETRPDARRVIYLDSLIHDNERKFTGWDADGAFSTILTEKSA